jgi:glycerophosphoryl diester phosphodiesterase
MAMADDRARFPGGIALWREAAARLIPAWQPLLGLHVVFTLLGIVLFAPLLGIAGRLLLRWSGEPAVADQDIAALLLSPFGLLWLVLFAALFIGFIIFEQAAMMGVALGVSRNENVHVLDALRFSASRARIILLFSAHLVARLLLITAPFLAVGAIIAFRSISEYDINYYLSERPPEFVRAALLIAVILAVGGAILVRKLVGWSIALPLVLFSDRPAQSAFGESTRAVAGRRFSVLQSLMLWALMSLALGALLLGTIGLVGGVTVPRVANDIPLLVIFLAVLGILLAAGNLFVTSITSGHFASLITVIFEHLAAATGARVSLPAVNAARDPVFTAGRLATALLVAAAAAIGSGAWLLEDIQTDDNVLVIAHRGAAGRAPENTLASIRAAIEDRADWVEIDVQESADGEVIVVHDSDFMKLAGDPVKVWDVTVGELSDIDVGGWFGSDFAGERVPTLRQVMETARGRANVVIELKYYGHDQQLEQRVADIVEATAMTDSVAIMSLKYEAVRKMKQIRPDWTVGLLSATAIGDLSRLDTDFLAVSTSMASTGFIRRARKAGKQVYAWTVNDPVTMSTMISRGVDGIITDEPAMAREVLADREALSTPERLLLLASNFFGRDFGAREYRDDSP